ncbi:PPIL4, partial [Symbiodinium microadriaticum]
MKLHYQHSHPDLVSRNQKKASTLCASYTGCSSPCLYSGASVAIPRLHMYAVASSISWYMQWIIRQETQLQILKQNSAWTLYLQPGQAGPVALLHQAAEKYREESKTRFMEVPALLKALHGISSDNNKQQILKDKGWLNAEGNWNYQQWDSEQQALKVSETRQPVNHQDLIGRIGQLTELVLGKDIIHQFNATHTLTPNKTGVTTFLLEVGLRAQGVETTWNTLEMIAGLSALQVIGLQIRREALVAWPTTFSQMGSQTGYNAGYKMQGLMFWWRSLAYSLYSLQ